MEAIRCTLISLLLFLIPQTVTVSGRILDRESKPAIGAKVLYVDTSTGRSYTTRTDKKGEFEIIGVAPGYYQITITAQDGQPIYSGKRNVRRITDDQQNRASESDNVLNVELSTSAPPGSAQDSNLAQGKLNKEQLDLVRKENANAVQINRLIAALHTQLDAQDWPHATETLQQLIALDPNRWEFYQNLGTIQSDLSHYQEAVQTLARGVEVAEKTLDHAPDLAKAQADIGGMLLSEGDAYNRLDKLDQAIALYTRAASILPQPAQAYYRACNC